MGVVADLKSKSANRLGRSDRSAAGRWFWEIDRVLLFFVAVLIAIGLIAVAAASPAAGQRLSGGGVSYAPLYYFYRQLVWIVVALPVMIAVSMLPRTKAKRWCLIGTLIFTALLFLVPIVGVEVNGARRWLGVGFTQFQPSEFLKPLYIVSIAWMLSLKEQDASLPVVPLSGICTGLIALLLMQQPNFGETIIFAAAWVMLLTLSGASLRTLGLLAVGGHPRDRPGLFLLSGGDGPHRRLPVEPAPACTIPTRRNRRFGLSPPGACSAPGRAPASHKFHLPEPHTDYIFSVIGEEFGIIACLAVAMIYLFIVARVLIRLLHEEDKFVVLAAAGLVCQFGLQALINMAVNVQIAPSKGMTLPFISYGGSSMVALSIGMGLLLAFTRRNPYLHRSPYVVKWSGR